MMTIEPESWHAKLRRLSSHSVVRYASVSVFPRAVSTIGILIITPLGLSQLGALDYSYWLLATAVTGLVVSPDLGIGNGVVNEFANVRARGDHLSVYSERIRGLLVLLGLIAVGWIVLGITAAFVYAYASAPAAPLHLGVAIALGFCCYLTAVPTAAVQRIQIAMESASRAVAWEGVGKVVAVVGAITTLHLTPNLYLTIVVYMLPVTVTAWVNALTYLKSHRVSLRGSVSGLTGIFQENRATMRLGRWFLLIQLCFLLLSSLDLYLLNAISGTEDVVYVSVIRRPFDLLPVIVSMYALALWPVFRRLHLSGSVARLNGLFIGATAGSATIIALGAACIVIFAGPVYRYLGAGAVTPAVSDLWLFALLVVCIGVGMVLTNFLNALDIVRLQAVVFLVGSLIIVSAKVIGTHVGGAHGFILSSAISYSCALTLPLLLTCAWGLRRAKRSEAQHGGAVEGAVG